MTTIIVLKISYVVIALLLCTKPSNWFIKKFIEHFQIIPKAKEGQDNTLLNAGKIIGSLERILTFILILQGQFEVIGFIIAAKSILRFKDTDTAKTEYLLIGSFLSFTIAIVLAIAYPIIVAMIQNCF